MYSLVFLQQNEKIHRSALGQKLTAAPRVSTHTHWSVLNLILLSCSRPVAGSGQTDQGFCSMLSRNFGSDWQVLLNVDMNSTNAVKSSHWNKGFRSFYSYCILEKSEIHASPICMVIYLFLRICRLIKSRLWGFFFVNPELWWVSMGHSCVMVMNTKLILNDVKSALVSLMGCGRKRREAILI